MVVLGEWAFLVSQVPLQNLPRTSRRSNLTHRHFRDSNRLGRHSCTPTEGVSLTEGMSEQDLPGYLDQKKQPFPLRAAIGP